MDWCESIMNLVTGGSGYFGINLVKRLIEMERQVRVIDLIEPPEEIKSKVEFVCCDVMDCNAVFKACEGVDTVYHTAALVPLSRAGKLFDEVNVGGTRNILEASFRNSVRGLVYISTSAVYGATPGKEPINEGCKIKPFGKYGMAKYKAELMCREYMKKGLGVSIIRPRAIIGPGRLGIFAILFEWLREGRNLYILGTGENRYQMISAYDLVEACILASKKGLGEVFNIGSSDFSTVRKELEELARHAGTGSRVVSINPAFAKFVLRVLDWFRLSPIVSWQYTSGGEDFVFDTSKAKDILGWKPRYGDVEMLERSYDWYLKNYDEIRLRKGTTHRSIPSEGLLRLIKYLF